MYIKLSGAYITVACLAFTKMVPSWSLINPHSQIFFFLFYLLYNYNLWLHYPLHYTYWYSILLNNPNSIPMLYYKTLVYKEIVEYRTKINVQKYP